MAAALAGTAAGGGPAEAQIAPATTPAPVTERQAALTRQYISLMLTDQFEDALREMIGNEAAQDNTLPDEDRTFIIDLTAELATDLIPQMIEEMVPVYAAAFTEAELEALVSFYDSEMGRSIAAKNVQVMPEANQAVMSVIPQMLDKMAARMCQHYGCGPGEMEEMRRQMREGAGLASAPAPARAGKAGGLN